MADRVYVPPLGKISLKQSEQTIEFSKRELITYKRETSVSYSTKVLNLRDDFGIKDNVIITSIIINTSHTVAESIISIELSRKGITFMTFSQNKPPATIGGTVLNNYQIVGMRFPLLSSDDVNLELSSSGGNINGYSVTILYEKTDLKSI